MIIEQDRRTLIRTLSEVQEHVIAVDGWYGSGKSWFARAAASCMGRKWVDLDQLLKKDQKAFVDHIDLAALANTISRPEPLILSGVCMREVLARVNTSHAAHVYVKRMHLGYWTHEEEAEGRGREVDAIYPPPPLEREVRSYHELWKPHIHAQYVYERDVNGRGL